MDRTRDGTLGGGTGGWGPIGGWMRSPRRRPWPRRSPPQPPSAGAPGHRQHAASRCGKSRRCFRVCRAAAHLNQTRWLRLPRLRLARPGAPLASPSSARTAPRPSPRRRPRRGGRRSSSPRTRSREPRRQQSDYWLGQAGPAHRSPWSCAAGATHYEPIAWDDAFELIAAELNALESPDEAVFYTSGRTSNEAAFLYQLFVRQFGTNNLPDCSNMCHESSGVGARRDHRRRARASVHARRLRAGRRHLRHRARTRAPITRACSRRCRRPSGAARDRQHQPAAGGRAASRFQHPQHPLRAARAAARRSPTLFLPGPDRRRRGAAPGHDEDVLRGGGRGRRVVDHDFIARAHRGVRRAGRDGCAPRRWDDAGRAAAASTATEIARAGATLIALDERIDRLLGDGAHPAQERGRQRSRRSSTCCCCAGNIGQPGAGPCPVRGHCNVQGDRTVGIYERPDGRVPRRAGARCSASTRPREHGLDTVETHPGHARRARPRSSSRWAATSSPPRPTPSSPPRRSRAARLTVHVTTKLNRSHLRRRARRR